MNMNNKNWVSVWGNAVSIAEHHPEAYAKYITLRYPVYIPFDGDTLRFTFDNYCGSEARYCHKSHCFCSHFPCL